VWVGLGVQPVCTRTATVWLPAREVAGDPQASLRQCAPAGDLQPARDLEGEGVLASYYRLQAAVGRREPQRRPEAAVLRDRGVREDRFAAQDRDRLAGVAGGRHARDVDLPAVAGDIGQHDRAPTRGGHRR
jgi:hypothetical protein